MAKRRGRDLMVGSTGALALLILALAVMSVGEQSAFLTRKSHYVVRFPNTEGLIIGSPVKLAGVQIGAVTGIRVPTSADANGVEVDLGIRRRYSERMREGSAAALRYLQIMSGEKFVDISAGDPARPALPEGAEIPVLMETEILEQGAHIAENLTEITVSLSRILEPLEKGEGVLGAMIQDPEFGKEGLARLHGTLVNLEQITEELKDGNGFLGRLVADREFAGRVDDISDTLESLSRFVGVLERREGALGPLLEEDGAAEQAILSLKEASASLAEISEKLGRSEGLVGRLINDPEYSEAMAEDLAATVHNLAEITRKVNEGEGTLGLLLNDKAVYEGMEDIAAGVNDSKFARWLTRHYRKKGIKLETGKDEKREDR